jgi:hypothetical protein
MIAREFLEGLHPGADVRSKMATLGYPPTFGQIQILHHCWFDTICIHICIYIYIHIFIYIHNCVNYVYIYIYDTVSRRLSPVSYIHSSFYFNDVLAISRLLLLFEPIQKCTVVSTALHGWQPPGVQTFEGPFRLSQALRLVFGLAVSVREDWRMTQGFATR